MASARSPRLPPRILSAARSILSLTPTPSSTTAAAVLPQVVVKPDGAAGAQVLDFDDTQRLFATVPSKTLLRSVAVMCAMGCEPVMDLGIAVMRSRVLERSRMARAVVMAAAKETVYRHFCAGEGVEEAGRTLQGLWDEGVRGILDYSLEDAVDNAGCDANLAEFVRTVETTSLLPPSSVSFACVKITAICPVKLLERVSDLLRWERKDPSTVLPWRRHSLPVLSDSSPLYHTPSAPPPLSPTEEHDLQLAHRRLSALCAKCTEFNLPLLVDAEYVSVQPAIDYITFDAAVSFNRGSDDPLVYGTIQAYLRDAEDRLLSATEAATFSATETIQAHLRDAAATVLMQVYTARPHGPHAVHLLRIPFPAVPSLPAGCESTGHLLSQDLFPAFLHATKLLRDPFRDALRRMARSGLTLPLCVVSDFFLGWTLDVCRSFGVPRLVFHGMGVFAMALSKGLVANQTHIIAGQILSPDAPLQRGWTTPPPSSRSGAFSADMVYEMLAFLPLSLSLSLRWIVRISSTGDAGGGGGVMQVVAEV